MKTLIIAAILASATIADAQTYVNPHTRRDGTFVPGYIRSTPDHTTSNNYSTQGNVNPYTNREGTVNPDRHSHDQAADPWQQPDQQIQTYPHERRSPY